MKNAGGEHGIGLAGEQDFGHVFQGAGPAARHHGHADGFADATGNDEVEPGFGAVGINGVQHNFSRAQGHGLFGPFNGVQAGFLAATMGEDAPAVGGGLFGVNGHHDALAAEFFGALTDEFGMGEGAGVDADFVRPGAEHGEHVVHGFDAAAHGEGHEALVRRAFDDVHHGVASVGGGGDVEEDHFIGALFVVPEGEFHGVADIAQAAFFGLAELDTAGDLAVVDVQAGNDTFCDHGDIEPRRAAQGNRFRAGFGGVAAAKKGSRFRGGSARMRGMTVFLRQLWGFVHPYRFRFFLGLLCGIGYGLANGLLLGVVKVEVDLIFDHSSNFNEQLAKAPRWAHFATDYLARNLPAWHAPQTHLGWVLLVAIIPMLMLLRNALQYLSIYLTNWSAMHAIADIRTRLFSHLQSLSLSFFNQASTGDLIARITNDTQVLFGIVGGTFASAVKDPVTILCLIGYQVIMQPALTMISLVIFPVCLVPIIVYGRKVRKSARAVQEYNAELTNLMHESFTGNRVIKAYNLENTVIGQFVVTTRKYVGQMLRVVRANEMPGQLMEVFGATGIALVFLYVQFLPKDQQPRASDFFAFVVGIVMIYPPIKAFTRLHNQLHQAKAASERVFELLATENSVPEPNAPRMLHASHADIEFVNVDFSYGEKPVLRGINLTVKAGQLVALVGQSGSGKTTLANLLLRFYDPVGGVIRIGGVDLREVTTKDLRNQIAVVTQETVLFNDTIRRNIELGRPGATEEQIIAAAKHAHAYEFVMQRPEGFAAEIGERGMQLSGGQRQRLAIARAVLKDAPILILDEATSALDTESERAVQAALDELMKGRTTICIAHRLSTILEADVIVVMEQGRIVESGRHADLVRRGGVYQKLYELQFKS